MLAFTLAILAAAFISGRAHAQATIKLHVLGYSVVSERMGSSDCNVWTNQYGFSYGTCREHSRRWVLNVVESDTTRYLLACHPGLFGKCSRLTDVGGIYDGEPCGNGMCVHVLYGKHRKPEIVSYQIVEAILRR